MPSSLPLSTPGAPWSVTLPESRERGLYRRVWSAVPQPSLLMDSQLRVLDVNDAYLATFGRQLLDLAGAPAFAPGSGTSCQEASRREIEASLRRAAASGRGEDGLVVRWDTPAAGSLPGSSLPGSSVPGSSVPGGGDDGGGLVERWWTIATVPITGRPDAPGGAGRVIALLSRLEDVTEVVLGRPAEPADPIELDATADLTVADVLAAARTPAQELRLRSKALARARDTERAISARLASLAHMARHLAGAQTLADLSRVVLDHGASVLGASSGALLVVAPNGSLELVGGRHLDAWAGAAHNALGAASALPGARCLRTGEPVLLSTRAQALAASPEMADWVAGSSRQAWAAVPLRGADGRPLGSLTTTWDTPQAFAVADVELLEAFTAMCAQALDNWQLRQAERARAASLEQLAVALQHSLLTAPVRSLTLQVAARYRPATEEIRVGGDWYDAFPDSRGRTLVAVGDVGGHGQEAAAAMGQVRNLLRGIARRGDRTPDQVLTELDDAVLDLLDGELATTVLAVVEQDAAQVATGAFRLRWSNAGHPPPLLIGADGVAELLTRPEDLMLGLDPSTPRTLHEVDVPPGACVVLYSDGLVERRGVHLDDSLASLVHLGETLAGLDVEELCDAIGAALGGDARDDVTLLAIQAVPTQPTLPSQPTPQSTRPAQSTPTAQSTRP